MSIIVEYAFAPDGVVLERTLTTVDVRLDIERIVATDPERPGLFAWATTDEPAAFDAAVAADPTVTDPQLLSDLGGKRLYRFQLTGETDVVLYPEWVKRGGEGLEAHFSDGWWYSRARFPDRESFTDYREVFAEHGIEFRLRRMYDANTDGEPRGRTADGLTDSQRETLKLAHERGYFDIPRRTTTEELGRELGISNQAVSERLRRGYARLVERVIGAE
ncbi:helix-turn-helix domain-containing protein [Natronomonas sp. EA1]|uniref:helix-turn-helix domain-containing protein n=1 Tax=Natronomonas sp. EA1 TaxID=3421655 RepID=UPI003EBE2882